MAMQAANQFSGAPLTHTSPQSNLNSHYGNDQREEQEESWSGDDSGEDAASRKRKRPMSVSCELCKQRKVKCDRGQPTCGWCLKNGQVCEYKERKKPGLRAGYGRELESRLDRLESILESQGATIAQLTANAGHPPPTALQDANIFNQPATVSSQDYQRPGSSNVTEQSSNQYPQPQTPNVQDYKTNFVGYNGFPQEVPSPFQKHNVADMGPTSQPFYNNPATPLQSPAYPPDRTAVMVPQELDLPPYDLLYTLADLYFKHVNTWCPILHRRTTLDTLFGTSSLDDGDRALLHSIVATSLRFSNDLRLTPDIKQRYHSNSKQKVLLYGLENSSVKALQAQVILSLDLCGDSNGPPGWNLLALITRSAVQLGLSVETTSQLISPKCPSIYTIRALVLPDPSNWIEDESRRRLFWMVYVLDRYATITTAFEFALDEKEIDRKLPCRDDLFSRNLPVDTRWFRSEEREEKLVDRPENLGSFSYYVEIVGILSKIHQFLKKPLDINALPHVERWQCEYKDLDAVLNAWKVNLPKEYGNMTRLFDSSGGNKIVNCGWVMLHATYHTTTIRLHSSAAYPSHHSQIFMPSFGASQRCLAAVEQISALCAHVRSAGMLNKLGPPFAFSVWVASRLLLVHSSTIDHQMDPNIHILLSTLQEMGTYWGVANRYAALLQRVLEEFSESERAPATGANGERVTPSSVKILADMRRCAYDLDILISRQPRQLASSGVPTMTPSRQPAPNELEYLDVFDFFNMPRLPVQGTIGTANGVDVSQAQNLSAMPEMNVVTEYNNMTNFMYDANTDWVKNPE